MLSELVLVAGMALQPDASVCPETRGGSALVASSVETLGVDVPELSFCLYGSVDGAVVWLWSLVAFDAESGGEIATLTYPRELKEGLGLLEQRFVRAPEFVDLDFDGYLDVGLRSFVGGTGNAGSHYWRFDPASTGFSYQSLLSGESLSVDPARRALTSSWKGGHAGAIYGKTTFGWRDGEATVVRAESRDWDDERSCYELSVRELVDGELVETTKECAPEP